MLMYFIAFRFSKTYSKKLINLNQTQVYCRYFNWDFRQEHHNVDDSIFEKSNVDKQFKQLVQMWFRLWPMATVLLQLQRLLNKIVIWHQFCLVKHLKGQKMNYRMEKLTWNHQVEQKSKNRMVPLWVGWIP